MSLADVKNIDIKHLENTPKYILTGIVLVVLGLLFIIAGLFI
jgi:hypothetical protein